MAVWKTSCRKRLHSELTDTAVVANPSTQKSLPALQPVHAKGALPDQQEQQQRPAAVCEAPSMHIGSVQTNPSPQPQHAQGAMQEKSLGTTQQAQHSKAADHAKQAQHPQQAQHSKAADCAKQAQRPQQASHGKAGMLTQQAQHARPVSQSQAGEYKPAYAAKTGRPQADAQMQAVAADPSGWHLAMQPPKAEAPLKRSHAAVAADEPNKRQKVDCHSASSHIHLTACD